MADKPQGCLEKNSKHNVAETRTDSSGEGFVPVGPLGIFWVGMCRSGLQIGTPF